MDSDGDDCCDGTGDGECGGRDTVVDAWLELRMISNGGPADGVVGPETETTLGACRSGDVDVDDENCLDRAKSYGLGAAADPSACTALYAAGMLTGWYIGSCCWCEC